MVRLAKHAEGHAVSRLGWLRSVVPWSQIAPGCVPATPGSVVDSLPPVCDVGNINERRDARKRHASKITSMMEDWGIGLTHINRERGFRSNSTQGQAHGYRMLGLCRVLSISRRGAGARLNDRAPVLKHRGRQYRL